MQAGGPLPVERAMALFSHLSALIGVPLLGPLVVYLAQRHRSTFAARHALWALLIQVLTVAAATLVGCVIWLLFGLGIVRESPGNLGLGLLPELLIALVIGFGPLVVAHVVLVLVGSAYSLSGKPAGWPLAGPR